MDALREILTPEKGLLSIRLPKEYTQKCFEVIVIPIEEVSKKDVSSQKEKLIAIFNKMKDQALFSEIDNPTQWQKQLRDEWE